MKNTQSELERRMQLEAIIAQQKTQWHGLSRKKRKARQRDEMQTIERLVAGRIDNIPRDNHQLASRAAEEINNFVRSGIIAEGEFDETHDFIEGCDAEAKRFRAERVLIALKNFLDGNDARSNAAQLVTQSQLEHAHEQIRRLAYSHIADTCDEAHAEILESALNKERSSRIKGIMQSDFNRFITTIKEKQAAAKKQAEEEQATARRKEIRLV